MGMKYLEGDRFILHSEDGNDYKIDVVSASPYRPPGSEYAVDVYLDGKSIYEDVIFAGEEFLNKCEKVKE